tara:strand:- start:507 stop:638 length:132 start_codon:yes stop_codon:yes gene_type:complete
MYKGWEEHIKASIIPLFQKSIEETLITSFVEVIGRENSAITVI